MIRILCYGDSNTWGYIPGSNGERYPENIRWTGIMSNALGEGYCVLEEGLSGRTAAFDDPLEKYRNGLKYIMPCLLTHKPVDLVILMLGTNDTRIIFHSYPGYITKSVAKIVEIIQKSECGRNGSAPRILVVAPPEIGENIWKNEIQCKDYVISYNDDSVKISKTFPEYYARMAKEYGCYFLNAARYAKPSEKDHLHLDEEGHSKIAQAMIGMVKEIFM